MGKGTKTNTTHEMAKAIGLKKSHITIGWHHKYWESSTTVFAENSKMKKHYATYWAKMPPYYHFFTSVFSHRKEQGGAFFHCFTAFIDYNWRICQMQCIFSPVNVMWKKKTQNLTLLTFRLHSFLNIISCLQNWLNVYGTLLHLTHPEITGVNLQNKRESKYKMKKKRKQNCEKCINASKYVHLHLCSPEYEMTKQCASLMIAHNN